MDASSFVAVVANAGDMVGEVSTAVKAAVVVTTAAQPCYPFSERRSAQNAPCHLPHSSFRLNLVVTPKLALQKFVTQPNATQQSSRAIGVPLVKFIRTICAKI
ncbi:MAG: hypothetical protein ACK4I8_09055 [Armatimonadota bacterium]